ncbi:uncharacterized protein LTR77_001443 [Saxophila tyrrhenica]|uniref:Rhodopsin domain-containing protein n=1 Tax=Saxophila tyrrhenica TaxID=1690608 RepID=A0AAV9PK45_9PEZI|nr:hypothetical protein LTR77_001443 [Saxophila tyrrhenica]
MTVIDTGLGKDTWTLSPQSINDVLKYFWIGEMIYIFCVTSTRQSILLFYLRIFPSSVSSSFRRICLVTMGVFIVSPIVFLFTIIFQCNPVSYTWTRWDGVTEGHCINVLAQIIAGSTLNTFYDLVVFILPIPRLLKVQISTRKKVGLIMTFLVGLFVTLCSVIRLSLIIRWQATTNPTWTYNPIALWSSIECNVGIICACIPALAGPLRRFWMLVAGEKLSSMYRSRTKSRTGASGNQPAIRDSPGWRGDALRPHGAHECKNSVMLNTYHNISDEMELMDKGPSQIESVQEGGSNAHNYKESW